MNQLEMEFVKKIQLDFADLKKKKKLVRKDEAQLLGDVTNLLGHYHVDPDRRIERLIEEMISFGEEHGEVVAGARISFEHMKKLVGRT